MIINKIDPIKYGLESDIDLRILREDLYPSFGGGNKARKLDNIYAEIKDGNYNAVVTTGSVYSNHCRATALMCSNHELALTLVLHGSKEEFNSFSGNASIIKATNHKIILCKPDEISRIMDDEIDHYLKTGKKPYYLNGGGHNKKGVEAYIDLVPDMKNFFEYTGWKPDYIFLPSGTGSTQAGLILGSIKYQMNSKIIGISIARNAEKGLDAIMETFKWFNVSADENQNKITFLDSYLTGGYALHNKEVVELSIEALKNDSLLLDTTYTAKALWGTIKYIQENIIKGNVLFVNTGGIFNYFKK
jgi:D-cysteine desulfhydrase